MIYVALLRGINVGGKSKVDMKQLKATFEAAGMESVKTYINSGNVIFESKLSANKLIPLLEAAITRDFKLSIRVLLRTIDQIKQTVEALPSVWQNNKDMKCDVMFLFPENDSPAAIEPLRGNDTLEDVRYIPGAILWRVDRVHITKSKVLKIVGTAAYKQMTVRNCNTVRKLHQLMLELQ